ncbi:anthranilate synthase component I [Halanaerobium saccharolyticum]|uniref:Anthranilate synthase component 1 n=1 Tax=Halanaerobium saccharolyticum TaxID=43595 RepID=A0A4R7ZF23_9FIRM|nr:anthranilate synthase component I [Halanaerobium saccharolyticum]RAK11894.1 anthranilate synthase component I [Halanaerobium saccharolyticum]TDW07735.1 anthranilate synthase component I [Halanaerobium saccharolyticum]TDX64656.1 anthranilate synthase component I [Halanaerobium saccharolyticum]
MKGKNEFLELTAEYNLIPIYDEFIADIETPISLYKKLALDEDYTYLLESSENDRYSFIGLKPATVLKNYDNYLEVIKEGKKEKLEGEKIVPYLQQQLAELNVYENEKLPPFSGGFVGYFNYEMIEKWEDIYHLEADKGLKKDNTPLSLLVMSKIIIAYDHLHNTVKIINNLKIESDLSRKEKEDIYLQAKEEIKKIKAEIENNNSELKPAAVNLDSKQDKKLKSNTTKKEYQKMVKKAKEHIRAGDIFQIVLSQKFSIKNDLPPFKIYRALRSVNPSPYSFYLNFPEIRIIGSSPEVLVRVRDQRVMTRPLAGTRRRGKDNKEDQKLKMDLLNDEKEKAEHTMLLDLGRNDLSRIAAPGSVEVTELMEVEFYSRVMHIVSQVEADLKEGLDSLDVLKAVFPAGTVSGAPKIKAIELIDGLEKEARGVYAGTVAYLSFNGNLDSCITIRTFSLVEGRLNLQVGAGIVADSDPVKEYQETLNKGRALFEALEVVREDGIRDFSN